MDPPDANYFGPHGFPYRATGGAGLTATVTVSLRQVPADWDPAAGAYAALRARLAVTDDPASAGHPAGVLDLGPGEERT